MFRTKEELQKAIKKFNIRLTSKETVVEDRNYNIDNLTELDVNGKFGIEQLEYDVIDSNPIDDTQTQFEYISNNHEISVVLSEPEDNRISIVELNNYIGLLENWSRL